MKFFAPLFTGSRSLLWAVALWPALSCSQDHSALKKIDRLPKFMKEVSGMEYDAHSGLLWMINDSGNTNEVFGYDPERQEMSRVIELQGATNVDWEDLAIGPDRTLYVGDFGNNQSKRQDLKIYGFSLQTIDSSVAARPWILEFSLEDQQEFPPKGKKKSYDIESFLYLEGHFYLFSRNRARKFDGRSKVYRLEARPGKQTARRIGTFEACLDRKDCQITSAALSPNGQTVALLSYNKIWLIRDFNGTDLLSGAVSKYKLHHRSQKESITFKDDGAVYVADERRNGAGRSLYLVDLKDLEGHAESE